MKKFVTAMLAVMRIMSMACAEVASPTLPGMQTVEIRDNKGEVIEESSGLIIEVIEEEVTEETEETEATEEPAETEKTAIDVKTEQITQAFAAIPGFAVTVPGAAEETAEETETTEPEEPADPEAVKAQVEEAYVLVFGEEVVETLKEVIVTNYAEEIVVGDLIVDEIVPLYIGGYEEEMGDVHAVVETVTEYKDEDVLVAMLGIVLEEAQPVSDEEGAAVEPVINWIPLTAVVEDGKVVIAFTAEAMLQGNGEENILILMRANEYEALVNEQE